MEKTGPIPQLGNSRAISSHTLTINGEDVKGRENKQTSCTWNDTVDVLRWHFETKITSEREKMIFMQNCCMNHRDGSQNDSRFSSKQFAIYALTSAQFGFLFACMCVHCRSVYDLHEQSECAWNDWYSSQDCDVYLAHTYTWTRTSVCVRTFISILTLLSLPSWIVRRHAFNIHLVLCLYVCVYAIINSIFEWKSTLVCNTCIEMLEHQHTTLWALPKCKQAKVPTLATRWIYYS